MQLLRKVASFGASEEELKIVYFSYVRSQLEQSSSVWHSSLTDDNKKEIERVQKTAIKIILKNNFTSYKKSLLKLNIDDLPTRRKQLCTDFAIKCTKHEKFTHMFPKFKKLHAMLTRKSEKFKVQFANTERLKRSPIIYMQKLLNDQDINFNNHEKLS